MFNNSNIIQTKFINIFFKLMAPFSSHDHLMKSTEHNKEYQYIDIYTLSHKMESGMVMPYVTYTKTNVPFKANRLFRRLSPTMPDWHYLSTEKGGVVWAT